MDALDLSLATSSDAYLAEQAEQIHETPLPALDEGESQHDEHNFVKLVHCRLAGIMADACCNRLPLPSDSDYSSWIMSCRTSSILTQPLRASPTSKGRVRLAILKLRAMTTGQQGTGQKLVHDRIRL